MAESAQDRRRREELERNLGWFRNVAAPALGVTAPGPDPLAPSPGIWRNNEVAARRGNAQSQAYQRQQAAIAARAAQVRAQRAQALQQTITSLQNRSKQGQKSLMDNLGIGNLLPSPQDFAKLPLAPKPPKDGNYLTKPEFGTYGGYLAHGQQVPGKPGDYGQQVQKAAEMFNSQKGFVPAPLRAAQQGQKAAQDQAGKVKDELKDFDEPKRSAFLAGIYKTQDVNAAVDYLGGLTGDTNKDASILRASKYSGLDITPIVRQKFVDTPEYQDISKQQQEIANRGGKNELSPGEMAAAQDDLRARMEKFYRDYAVAFGDALDKKKDGGVLGQSKATIDDAKKQAMDVVKPSTSADVINAVRAEQQAFREADMAQDEQRKRQEELSQRPSQRLLPEWMRTAGRFIPGVGLGMALGETAYDTVQSNAAQKRVEELIQQSSDLTSQAAKEKDPKKKKNLKLQAAALQEEISKQAENAQLLPTTREAAVDIAGGALGVLTAGALAGAAKAVPGNIQGLANVPRAQAVKQIGKGVAGNVAATSTLGAIQAAALGQPIGEGALKAIPYGLPFLPLGLRPGKMPSNVPSVNLLPLADRAQPGLLQRPILGTQATAPIQTRGMAPDPVTNQSSSQVISAIIQGRMPDRTPGINLLEGMVGKPKGLLPEPPPGAGAPYRAVEYRGLRPNAGVLREKDGIWSSPERGYAEGYGDLKIVEVDLKRPFVADTGTIEELRKNKNWVKKLEKQGYDGVVDTGVPGTGVPPTTLSFKGSGTKITQRANDIEVSGKENQAFGPRDVEPIVNRGVPLKPGSAKLPTPNVNLLGDIPAQLQKVADSRLARRKAKSERSYFENRVAEAYGQTRGAQLRKEAQNTSFVPEKNTPVRKQGGKMGKITWFDRVFQRDINRLDKLGASGREAANRLRDTRDDTELIDAAFRQKLKSVEALHGADERNFALSVMGYERPANPRVQAAYDEWLVFRENAEREALKYGILKPGQARPDYWPQKPNKDFVKSTKFSKLVAEKAKREGISTDEAAASLDSTRPDTEVRSRRAGLEFTRDDKLSPDEIRLDKGVAFEYAEDLARRIAEARNLTSRGKFGPEKLPDALNEIIGSKLASEGARQSDVAQAEDIVRRALGTNKPPTGTRTFSTIRQVMAATKLGLASIANMTQVPVNTMPVIGGLRSARAVKAALARDPEMKSFVAESGTVTPESIRKIKSQQVGTLTLAGDIGAPGFSQIEYANRYVATVGGRIFAIDMGNLATGSGRRAQLARSALDKLGLDSAKIVERGGKLTRQEQITAARNIVERTQFKLDVQDLPGWATHPVGRTLFQFKSFVYNQTAYVGRELGGAIKERNPAPLIRYGIAAVVFGGISEELQYRIKTAISGKPDEDREYGLGDIALRGFKRSGGLGFVSELPFSFKPAYEGEKGVDYFVQSLRTLSGPFFGTLEGLALGVSKAVLDKNSDPIKRELLKTLPFGSNLSRRFAPSKSEKIEDEKETRVNKLNNIINNLQGTSKNPVELTTDEVDALSQVGALTDDNRDLMLEGTRSEAHAKIDDRYEGDTKKADAAKRAYDKISIGAQAIYQHIIEMEKAKEKTSPIERLEAETKARNAVVDDRVVGNKSLVSGQDLAQFQRATSGGGNEEDFFNLQEQTTRDIQALQAAGNRTGAARLEQWWNELLKTLPSYTEQASRGGDTTNPLLSGASTYLNTPTERFTSLKNQEMLPVLQQTPEQFYDFAGMSKKDKAKLQGMIPQSLFEQLTAGADAFKQRKSGLSLNGGGSGGSKGGRKGKKGSKGRKVTVKKPKKGRKASIKKPKSQPTLSSILPTQTGRKKPLTFEQILRQLNGS